MTVTATTSPASGGSVDQGSTITYTLKAQSQQPLAAGASVVDDVPGLLANATVVTPKSELAEHGLTLNAKAKRLTWKVPPLDVAGNSNTTATASFRATVSSNAPKGAVLTTAAHVEGGTCAADLACATKLTVADHVTVADKSTPSKTPTVSASASASPKATPADPPTLTKTSKAVASGSTSQKATPANPPTLTKTSKAAASGSTSPKATPTDPPASLPPRTPAALPLECTADTIFNIAGSEASPPPTGSADGNIYSLNVNTGVNTLIGFFGTGGTTRVTVPVNGLAVTPNLSDAFAVAQNSATGGQAIYTHTQAGVNSATPGPNTGVTMVMGAVDPTTGLYYYAGYTGTAGSQTNPRRIVVYGYDPATTTALGLRITVPIPAARAANSTGDMAFDANGNLFIVSGTNNATGSNSSQVFRVDGPFSATGGAVTRTPTELSTSTAPAGSGFYNGIALSADGTLYAQYARSGTPASPGSQGYLVRIDPNTGATIGSTITQTGTPAVGILTDLAGCSLPGTLTVRKNLPQGRAATGDQFTMQTTGGGITEGNTATTTGNSAGIQNETEGPRPAVPGVDYTISETLAPGSPSTLADYTSTWECVDTISGNQISSGTGTSFTLSFPNSDNATQGAVVVCTFTNTPGPADITLVKSADPTTYGAAGEQIVYSFRVTNSGNVTLDNIALTDDHLGTISCPQTSLAPGEDMICTADYTTTQADVNNGSIHNSATVTGDPPTGPPVTDTDDETVTADHAPGITLVKSADPTTYGAAGEPIVYSFRVTNSGNVTLDNVALTDDHLGTISCPQTSLDPGEHMDCTATYVTTQADVNNGSIHNSATVTGDPPTGPPVTDTDDEIVTADHAPGITLEKSADPTTYGAAGEQIVYSFRVTNSGNVTLDNVALTDDHLGAISCPQSSLDPGEDMVCTATYVTTQADVNNGSIHNSATVTGDPPTGPPVTDTDDETVTADHAPGITLVKSADPPTYGAAGEQIVYSFRVTNSGNVTLTNVGLVDDKLGPINCPQSSLDPGEDMICTATYVTTQGDVNNGSIHNSATVTGDPPTGRPVTDTDDETVTAEHAPGITLQKSADPTTYGAAGEQIVYSFRVTNSGNVTLTGISLTDSRLGDLACPQTSLDPGEDMICTADYTTTQADVNNGSIHNSATVTGDPPTGPPVTDTDDETVTADHAPGITVVKTASPETYGVAGEQIVYSFRVTNSGNVTLTNVSLVDDKLGPINCPQSSLDPGEHMICTADYTTTQADVNNGSIHNSATVTGDPPTGPPVTDTDDETVTAVHTPEITVVKTADPETFAASGQQIVYSFRVTNSGNVTLTNIGLVDDKLGPINCPQSSLDPGEHMICTATYVTTQADVNNGSIHNSATVTGDPPTGPPVTDTDDETVTADHAPGITVVKTASPETYGVAGEQIVYSFRVTNSGNVTLTNVGLVDDKLGPINCPQSSLDPGEHMICTAAYTTTQADVNNGSIHNSATVTGDPPTGPPVTDTDDETVTAVHTPEITVVKTADPETFAAAGQQIVYSFRVTNSGNVTLTNVGLVDDKLGPINCPQSSLDPGEHMICTADYTTTQADVNNGSIHNSATVTGDPPTGPPVTDTDDETVTAEHAPGITLQKSADPETFNAAGDVITYAYRVTNTGNVTLTNIGLTDDKLGSITCPRTSLDPGEHMDCTASHTTTQADVNNGSIHNSATVTADPPEGPAVTDTDDVTVEFTGTTPPTPTPPTPTPTPPPPGPQPPAPPQPGPVPPPLAGTGLPANVPGLTILAGALIVAGGIVTIAARRRRRKA